MNTSAVPLLLVLAGVAGSTSCGPAPPDGEPKRSSFAVTDPVGTHDVMGCKGDLFRTCGWACDSDSYSTQLRVEFYIDDPYPSGKYLGGTKAHTTRPDVASVCGGYATHGFEFVVPGQYRTSGPHPIYAYAVNSDGNGAVLLNLTPRSFTMNPNAFLKDQEVYAYSQVLDVPYGPDPAQKLDLYFPQVAGVSTYPLVAFVHGGGWVMGDKGAAPGSVMASFFGKLAGRGMAVASINYRLASKDLAQKAAQIEDQVYDVKGALRWLMANASARALDPTRATSFWSADRPAASWPRWPRPRWGCQAWRGRWEGTLDRSPPSPAWWTSLAPST